MTRTRWFTALALGSMMLVTARADDPKPADTKAQDKAIRDALRDVHNKGADLYNTDKDYPGTYHLYQGALLTIRPLLAHQPAAQKIIDDGLAAATKEPEIALRAFKLHETIESVRQHLKASATAPTPKPEPMPKPDPKVAPEPKPVEPKKPTTPEPKPTTPEPKPVEPKKPTTPEPKPTTPAPTPVEPKKTTGTPAPIPTPGMSGKVSGIVTLMGKPLAEGDLLLVSRTQPQPRTFAATIKDGAYSVADPIPAGTYIVTASGKGVPAKFATTDTSSLTVEVKAGTNTFNIDLK